MSRRWRRRPVPRRAGLWPRVWRRRPLTLVGVLTAAVLLAWARLSVPLGSDYDRYHNKNFVCVKVVDGDTLDIAARDGRHQNTRIRLWGVDTPETAKSDRGAMYYGAEASAFTRSLVEGRSVRLVLFPHKTRDRYGRLLAYVYLDNTETMLNEEILSHGMGYADRRFEHVWKERFTRLEERARKQMAGLWREVRPDQFPEWLQRHEAWRASHGP